MGAANEGVTKLLAEWRRGDETALDRLAPLVYAELLRLARRHMARERPSHTLEPTALVHEAFLRMMGQRAVSWQNRAHFYAIAAGMMRRVLVDYARKRGALKRAPGGVVLTLDAGASLLAEVDVVRVDEALEALAVMDPRQARIVELRYFGGHSIEETAEVLQISPATVKREWATARLWLRRDLRRDSSSVREPKRRRTARSLS